MTRKLQVIKIGNSPIFNREGTIWQEENDIIILQKAVADLVNDTRKFAGNKKEFASVEIERLVGVHSYLNARFENLQSSIRELARAQW